MKSVPPPMQANLDSRATTHCRLWRVERRDGAVFGFTDHDRPLTLDSLTYEAASGFTATSIETSLGLGVDNLDVEGALSSSTFTEDDIVRGLWDDADIEVWLADWTDPSNRLLLRKGNIGEITRGPTAFLAELRGLAHRLGQTYGRQFDRTCSWELGDARCKVALAGWTFSGAVVEGFDLLSFTASGLDDKDDGLFRHGLLTWNSGGNSGRQMEIKRHSNALGTVTFELSLLMADSIETGDAFSVQAGCDKSFSTCKARFLNGANFGGFPHIPGNQVIIGYADKDDLNDGGSLFR
ncbi:DUF2163 domain-containing protein [Labrenzia sp. PHM005]|uniref:DUF2163 domain-containing protein n=1 Tax=Labrenzia sp. PHM005 TaxID=2590016 RepID=UPI00113FD216|nr:DUF2163 domain-containing protein [Labrenzia sp. PHM005]QDG74459.1 DUF2163 domain-containing protein [Labrenzia sp. PHM005]